MSDKEVKIGVISDTHGRLHPAVFQLFEKVDYIIHAGDIGDADILIALQALAPTIAVFGNTDSFDLRDKLQAQASLEIYNHSIKVTHIPQFLSRTQFSVNEKYHIYIFGHTHKAKVEKYDHTLILNPGSATQSRSKSKPSIALLYLRPHSEPRVEIVELP